MILSVIYKFSSRVTLIFDKSIYSTSQWVNVLINRLFIVDWDISNTIISDRDFKFSIEHVINVLYKTEYFATHVYSVSFANERDIKEN